MINLRFSSPWVRRPSVDTLRRWTFCLWGLRLWIGFIAAAAAHTSEVGARSPEVEIAPPAPPHLLLSEGDFIRMNDWAARQPWASGVVSSLLERADAWPWDHIERFQLETFELPPEGGQWTQYYFCPVHGFRLIYVDPVTHVCPEGEAYSGWPYDQVVYTWRIDDAALAARDLGLAYRLTGQESYAQASADVLLAFARAYLTWPIHDEHDVHLFDGARAHAQTLDEAEWLIDIAWAYDLVADSPALSENDRASIQRFLLYPAARILQRYKTKGNWQVWHNAGLAAVGYALDDAHLIAVSSEGKTGMLTLLRLGVDEDGLWWEGTWGYHFYALEPFVIFAEMARLRGLDLYSDKQFQGMFLSPLKALQPDLVLPPFNDTRAYSIASFTFAYEVAWSRFGEPRAAAVASLLPRGEYGLFFGTETLPSSSLPPQGSEMLWDGGFAFLRQPGLGGESYVAFDFGKHGGWHGHYDKLSFISYGAGTQLGLDPGTQSYAAPTHETWDKRTVAHNTVVLDERNQPRNQGAPVYFHALPHAGMVMADGMDAYPGADGWRTLILTSEYLLDRFNIRAHSPIRHQFDWIFHSPGTVFSSLPLEPYDGLPEDWGYQHLTGTTAAALEESFSVNFLNSSGRGCTLRMAGAPSGETTVVTGWGLGPDLSAPIPFVMARREGISTTFLDLLEPTQETPRTTSLETIDGTGLSDGSKAMLVRVTGLSVDRGDGLGEVAYTDQWVLASRGGESWAAGDFGGDGTLAWTRDDASGIRGLELTDGTYLTRDREVLVQADAELAGLEAWVSASGVLEVVTEDGEATEVYLYAPEVTSVVVNGVDVELQRIGDLIWLPLI